MQPVLGRKVVEAEQRLEVVAELLGGLRPLGRELVVEGLGRVSGMFSVLGVSHLGEHLLRERLDGLGQGVEDVGGLVHPTPLLFGLREHVSKGRPEPERSVSDSHDRGAHVAMS